jgi:hypothetical protein
MKIEWRVLLTTVGILAVVVLGASHFFDLPRILTLLLGVAVVFTGIPDGSGPLYASRIAMICKWVLAAILVAFAIAFMQAGLSVDNGSELTFAAGTALACVLSSLALFIRRRWLLFAALVSGFAGFATSLLVRRGL